MISDMVSPMMHRSIYHLLDLDNYNLSDDHAADAVSYEGPFSHLYDGKFLPAIHHNHSFAHEHASIGLLDLLIEQNDLRKDFTKHGLGDDDIQFIKELMLGQTTTSMHDTSRIINSKYN